MKFEAAMDLLRWTMRFKLRQAVELRAKKGDKGETAFNQVRADHCEEDARDFQEAVELLELWRDAGEEGAPAIYDDD